MALGIAMWTAYTTDVEGIAKDLLTLFSAFLKIVYNMRCV